MLALEIDDFRSRDKLSYRFSERDLLTFFEFTLLSRNDRGKPPFAVAGNKETRNEFRRFMALYPDRYDYAKAQVWGFGWAGVEGCVKGKGVG